MNNFFKIQNLFEKIRFPYLPCFSVDVIKISNQINNFIKCKYYFFFLLVIISSYHFSNNRDVKLSWAGDTDCHKIAFLYQEDEKNIKYLIINPYKTALYIIENSPSYVSGYTKSRDKCLALLYFMTPMTLTALSRMRVKDLKSILQVDHHEIRLTDSDKFKLDKRVDLSNYNLPDDIKTITEGKEENDFLLTQYMQKRPMHRITISRRLNTILDQVAQHHEVEKKMLYCDLPRKNLAKK